MLGIDSVNQNRQPNTMITQESNLDLTKVAALQQKRTLAFVNHFVVTTVQFLNGFMKRCEQKLMNFERKLEKVEAAMVLLESRLSSIPEVNTPQTDKILDTAATPAETPAPQLEPQSSTDNSEESTNTENTKENAQVLPEYNRFVKMVQVGVPLEAVKLKVSLEGLDPGVFERIVAK